HLANLAASFTVLDRVLETEHAVAGDQSLDLARLWCNQTDAHAVADFGDLDSLEHLRKETSGVKREHIDIGAGLGDGVQERLILEPEVGREDDASLDSPPHLPDAIGKVLYSREVIAKLVGLFLRGIPTERLRIAQARLIGMAQPRERRFPSPDRPLVSDLSGIEAGAQ